MDLSKLSPIELMRLQADAVDELIEREVVRSRNQPIADFAELLFCKALELDQAGKVEKDADAVGSDGTRYQIKSRRPTPANPSRQLGFIRRLPEGNFDVLAAVLFAPDFTVLRAALIPHSVVQELASYVKSVNAWRMHLRDDVWSIPNVQDVTHALQAAASSFQ